MNAFDILHSQCAVGVTGELGGNARQPKLRSLLLLGVYHPAYGPGDLPYERIEDRE